MMIQAFIRFIRDYSPSDTWEGGKVQNSVKKTYDVKGEKNEKTKFFIF